MTIKVNGLVAISATGTKSATGSYGSFLCSVALIASGVLVPTSKVYPSGAAFATEAVPVTMPAPVRFSTTTGLPRRAANACPNIRPRTSTAPPAATGTTRVICRSGYSFAVAPCGTTGVKARATDKDTAGNTGFIVFLSEFGLPGWSDTSARTARTKPQ